MRNPPERPLEHLHALVEAAVTLGRSGINRGTSGNLSLRHGDRFVVTPSGVRWDRLRPSTLVTMEMTGDWHGSLRPSSEWRIHRDIYLARPDVRAVVHTHSVHATALSCLRKGMPAFHYMIAAAGGNSIRCAEYATYGTEALSRATLRALDGRNACLLANHGVVAIGADLDRATDLAVEVEALARIYLKACENGVPVLLDDTEMARVLEKFTDYGQPAGGLAPASR